MRIPKLTSAVTEKLRNLAFRSRTAGPQEVEGQPAGLPALDPNEEWIPLAAASRIMYHELAGTQWRTLADQEPDAESRLNFIAGCLVRNVPIEGRSPPSSTHRSIPSGDFEAGIIKGGGRYFQRHYESYLTFLDMRVRVEDLHQALERMRTIEP